MASGRKNYFRHSINARNDEKVVDLVKEHGKEAYYHYFVLLELCASRVADCGYPEDGKFIFMKSTLCKELMVTPSKLAHHLMAIQSSLLGHLVVTEKNVVCSFPKLLKYIGSYESKLTSNSPKEKKRKEKKIKEPPTPKITEPEKPKRKQKPDASGGPEPAKAEPGGGQAFVAAYCEAYKQTYGKNPTITRAAGGFAKRLSVILNLDRFREMLEVYFSMDDKFIRQKGHPLSLIESNIPAIEAAENGIKTGGFSHRFLKAIAATDPTESDIGPECNFFARFWNSPSAVLS